MNPDGLESAFALFAKETGRLENAYLAAGEKLDQLNAQLESTEKRHATIIQHIPDALLLVRLDGTIAQHNGPCVHLLGKSDQELTETLFWDLFEDTLFGFSMREALETNNQKKDVMLTLVKDGKQLSIEVSATPIKKQGLLVVLRDRTPIQQLERALRQSDRLKELGQMAATLAHEIRNPLGGIEGFASLLEEDLEKLPHQQKMARSIVEGVRALNQTVTSILDYTRPCCLNFEKVEVCSFLEKWVAFLSKEQQARLEMQLEPCSFYIQADPVHLGRAIFNLVCNGLDASKKKVLLRLQKSGELHIIDRGAGIPQEELEKIFTPFFTTKTQGTGLGLSEVDKILKAHDFTIAIESSTKGTTFKIGLLNHHAS